MELPKSIDEMLCFDRASMEHHAQNQAPWLSSVGQRISLLKKEQVRLKISMERLEARLTVEMLDGALLAQKKPTVGEISARIALNEDYQKIQDRKADVDHEVDFLTASLLRPLQDKRDMLQILSGHFRDERKAYYEANRES